MTIASFQTALVNLLGTVSGLGAERVMLAYSDGPRPELPYLSLLIPTVRRIGEPWVGDVDEAGNQSKTHTLEMLARVQCYGNQRINDAVVRTPLDIVMDVQDALQNEASTKALCEAGLVLYDEGTATDVSQLIGIDQEDRALVDLGLRAHRVSTEFVSWVESVAGEICVNNRLIEPFEIGVSA